MIFPALSRRTHIHVICAGWEIELDTGHFAFAIFDLESPVGQHSNERLNKTDESSMPKLKAETHKRR